MSPPQDPLEFRGSEGVAWVIRLDEAAGLPGLRGRDEKAIRRALEPVRVGRWLPQGARHWRVVYDRRKVLQIASALEEGNVNPFLQREHREPARRPSSLPAGVPEGWATAEGVWLALRALGYDATYVSPRWIRERLERLRVLSERRVVVRISRVFPLREALWELQRDSVFCERVGGSNAELERLNRRVTAGIVA